MKPKLHIISTFSFVLICLLFFLPFINIECGNQKAISISGMELITGTIVNTPSIGKADDAPHKVDPNIYAIIAFFSGIFGIVFSLVLRGKNNLKNIVTIFAGIISLSLIILQVDNARVSKIFETRMAGINYELGYWLCLVIPIILIAYTLMTKGQPKKSETSHSSTAP